MNLASIIERHPADATAVIDGDRTLTYGQLRAAVAEARGVFAARGVVPGDRVGLIAPNRAGFVVAYLAIAGAGAVAVPLNSTSPPLELGAQLGVVEPKAVVVVGRDLPGEVTAGIDAVMTEADLEGGAKAEPVPVVDRSGDDLCALLFTSGTAGAPRAAMLTHRNLLANIAQVQAHPGRAVAADDVVLGVLPLFHVFGLNVVLGLTLAAGGALVLEDRFDVAEGLALVARHRVTVLCGAPPLFAALVSAPATDDQPLASVRLAVSGAAALPETVSEAFLTRFGVPIHQGYGLTEAAPVVTASPMDGTRPRPGSIGVPLPGVEVRLVDDDGEDAYVGDPGEVWVRGDNVFPGYWRDPDATRSVLTADGWLRTGDIAVAGDDGVLQLVDRAKDLIIVSGFNVYPTEVEDVLRSHRLVADAAVVGVPDERTGEAVMAVVVPVPGSAPTLADLRRFSADRLASYKCPTLLTLVPELPLGAGGKVLRRQLRSARAAAP